MIIVAIIALSGVVLTALYAALVGFPPLPSAVTDIYNQFLPYVQNAAGLLYGFTYAYGIREMLRVTIAVEGIVLTYKFLMWVVKKIPMFGVSD